MKKNNKPFWRYWGRGWFVGVAYLNNEYELVWTTNPSRSPARVVEIRNSRNTDVQDVTQYVAHMVLDWSSRTKAPTYP